MANDVFRQEYTPLTDEQKTQMSAIKQAAQALYDKVEEFVPADERSERARLVNIGKTQLEVAVAMIVKGITTEQLPS